MDRPSLDTACPRYFGAAYEHVDIAHIALTWTGPASPRIAMDSPLPHWTLIESATPIVSTLNAVSRVLPTATW